MSSLTDTQADLANPFVGENPYAAPVIVDEPKPRMTNLQVLHLGYLLRTHGLLTLATLVLAAIAYSMTGGPLGENFGSSYWLGILLFLFTALLVLALGCLSLDISSKVFPRAVSWLAAASMIFLVPVSWPFVFAALHFWGRRVLKEQGMRIGVFGKPTRIATVEE